jgi:hypothetical protein
MKKVNGAIEPREPYTRHATCGSAIPPDLRTWNGVSGRPPAPKSHQQTRFCLENGLDIDGMNGA